MGWWNVEEILDSRTFKKSVKQRQIGICVEPAAKVDSFFKEQYLHDSFPTFSLEVSWTFLRAKMPVDLSRDPNPFWVSSCSLSRAITHPCKSFKRQIIVVPGGSAENNSIIYNFFFFISSIIQFLSVKSLTALEKANYKFDRQKTFKEN